MRLMLETKGVAENRGRSFKEFILDSAVEKAIFSYSSCRRLAEI
jgi:hypothetical protein